MAAAQTPSYALFGIAADSSAPLPYHVERISDRRELHNGLVEAHSHPHIHQLTYWINGGGEYVVDGVTHQVKRGDVCWIPAGTIHGFSVSRKSDAIVLSISRAFSAQHIFRLKSGALPIPGVITLDAAAADLIRVLFSRAEQEYAGRGWAAELAVDALTQLAVIEIDRRLHAEDESSSGRLLKSALFEAIERRASECYRDHPTVATFARDLGSTPYLVNRACMQATGDTISTYLRGWVLREAERLLMFTSLDIATIATLVGFADPSHFSRAFRANRGKSPRDWRQECTAS